MIIVINGRVFPTHPTALKGAVTAAFLHLLFNAKPTAPVMEIVDD